MFYCHIVNYVLSYTSTTSKMKWIFIRSIRFLHFGLRQNMGLIHTPRTIYSIANGLTKRYWFYRSSPGAKATSNTLLRDPTTVAIGENNHHIYQARLGLLDVDYLGHMNNGMLLLPVFCIVNVSIRVPKPVHCANSFRKRLTLPMRN